MLILCAAVASSGLNGQCLLLLLCCTWWCLRPLSVYLDVVIALQETTTPNRIQLYDRVAAFL